MGLVSPSPRLFSGCIFGVSCWTACAWSSQIIQPWSSSTLFHNPGSAVYELHRKNTFTAHMVGALSAEKSIRALFHSASSSSRIYTLARASLQPSDVLLTTCALKSVSAECPWGPNISDPCQLSTPSLETLLNGGLWDSTLSLLVALYFTHFWQSLSTGRLLSAIPQFCLPCYVFSSEERAGTESWDS